MVLADRNSEDARNGRRSRGPSPNGHVSDTTSSEDDREGGLEESFNLRRRGRKSDGRMRVGRDFQAVIPECIPQPERERLRKQKPHWHLKTAASAERRLDQCPERALLVWSPTADIPDVKLEEYISLAKEKYGYNAEQALGMLFWHKHDLEKAILDLANFTPFPDEWTVEDRVLFEQAFQFHGKTFHRIRQMLPDKSISSLVKYYYSWKKTRTRTSLMDRQARRLAAQREEGSDVASELGSNSDSESEDKQEGKRTINRGIRRESGLSSYVTSSEEKDSESVRSTCANCGVLCTHLHGTPKGNMCNTCHHYWKRNGGLRPTTGPLRREGRAERQHHHLVVRHKRKPPRGMYINHDDLVVMATGPSGQGDAMLKAMDREIVSLKRQVQNNKQMISSLKRITGEGVEEFRVPDNNNRINARWTNDELLLAVQGVRKYGKDFKAIAEVIGTKTEAHLRSFFVNYRRRYNLDAVLKEYEAENGPIAEEEKEEKMEVDGGPSSGSEIGPPTPGASSPVTVGSLPLPKQSPARALGLQGAK